jgi:hypothetical protein
MTNAPDKGSSSDASTPEEERAVAALEAQLCQLEQQLGGVEKRRLGDTPLARIMREG